MRTRPVDDLGMQTGARPGTQQKGEGGWGVHPQVLLVLYQEQESVCEGHTRWALPGQRLTRPGPTSIVEAQKLAHVASWSFPPGEQIVNHLPPCYYLGLSETLSGELCGQNYLPNKTKLLAVVCYFHEWTVVSSRSYLTAILHQAECRSRYENPAILY